ncbi:putative beta (1-3) glucanosyltransferase gel3p [Coniochaeta sp. 2T2.1]|nr:putative beta (1-3) glucanosyltransferase gel3p [Coniochaeta sp. 2T2.1]
MGFTKSAIVSSLLLLGQAAAIDPIVMKGSKFFFQNGTQFFMKGIAYQEDTAAAGGESTSTTFMDPLADEAKCKRDVPLLAALHTNTIRTYAIDPTADHSVCMKLLADAGIYVISDLGEPRLSINRDDPQWNTDLYSRYKAVVDEMGKYDNVIGFFAGNEVTNNRSNTDASAYVKAAVRDTKKHIADKGGRWMGVGYAANDDADIRVDIAHYFNCGDQESAIDFWGYNIYSWCGKSTFEASGYKTQVDFFKNYSVPVFFAEYGCNTQGGAEGRIWEETTALYSDEMTPVINGGIVYMYFQEANDYGVVSVNGGKASTMKNYNALKTVIASVAPSSTASSAYTPTNTPAACPALNQNWQASGNNLPPTPDSALCECMYNSLSCQPNAGLSPSKYGDIFNFICDAVPSACGGINGNTSTGVYGAFLGCNDQQKLGYVLNEYYKSQKNAASACDFKGQAQINSKPNTNGNCGAALSSASAANSVAATATKASSTATASDKNAASPVSIKALFSIGDVAVGLYVLVAMGVGATMVVL